MTGEPLRIIAFGAHPDDCDIFAGGLAAKYAAAGHKVKFVSLTNGDAGHYEMTGDELASRRYKESQAAAGVIGIDYDVLYFHDGLLEPTLLLRHEIIRLIRKWKADIVLTHRPNDYHPDHRYAAMAVQDSAYMIAVPNICSDTPALRQNVHYFYFWDHFKKPLPFQPDIAIAVDDVMEQKWEMVACHESQFFEWLPYIENFAEPVPDDPEKRREWLVKNWTPFLKPMRNCCQSKLEDKYGNTTVEFAECFEICEYGKIPDEEELKRLFPF